MNNNTNFGFLFIASIHFTYIYFAREQFHLQFYFLPKCLQIIILINLLLINYKLTLLSMSFDEHFMNNPSTKQRKKKLVLLSDFSIILQLDRHYPQS